MKKSSKQILIPLALVLLIAAVVARVFFFKGEFLYAGTVEATLVDLPARISSVVATVPVQEGQDVKKGDALMTLAGEDLRLAAETVLQDFQRAEVLHRSGSMPKEAFDHLRLKRDDAVLRVKWTNIESRGSGSRRE